MPPHQSQTNPKTQNKPKTNPKTEINSSTVPPLHSSTAPQNADGLVAPGAHRGLLGASAALGLGLGLRLPRRGRLRDGLSWDAGCLGGVGLELDGVGFGFAFLLGVFLAPYFLTLKSLASNPKTPQFLTPKNVSFNPEKSFTYWELLQGEIRNFTYWELHILGALQIGSFTYWELYRLGASHIGSFYKGKYGTLHIGSLTTAPMVKAGATGPQRLGGLTPNSFSSAKGAGAASCVNRFFGGAITGTNGPSDHYGVDRRGARRGSSGAPRLWPRDVALACMVSGTEAIGGSRTAVAGITAERGRAGEETGHPVQHRAGPWRGRSRISILISMSVGAVLTHVAR